MKYLVISILVATISLAHPVPYSINLTASFNQDTKEVTITCKSDSKNKCGLHNFHLLDKNEKIIVTSKFPFLKKQKTLSCEKKPTKMIFFLRKIPEHQYIIHF